MARTARERPPRLVYVVTHAVSANTLLRGQLSFMRESGFEVTLISAPGPDLDDAARREGVASSAVAMARDPAPKRDARGLIELTWKLRRLSPDIVNAGTPKAGLLGMLASYGARVPIRIYVLRGLRLETATGRLRRVLGAAERLASSCAHEVVCNSTSLRDAAVGGGFVDARKARVLGHGSSGVDTSRFPADSAQIQRCVRELEARGVCHGDPVIGFVGRLVADKGIRELLDAFARVRKERPDVKLLLVGGDFADEQLDASLAAELSSPGVISVGRVADVSPYYSCMSVLAFPSLREGFPNVVLEAACARIPTVGARATGTVDAIVDGETGTLVPPADAERLASALLEYLEKPDVARARGEAARARAVAQFDRRRVWQLWLEHYRELLASRGLPLPRA